MSAATCCALSSSPTDAATDPSASDPVARFLTRLRARTRICLVIFGAVMIHLTIGTYHTFGNMLPYMASYMRNYTDSSVKIEHLIWIPTFQGCFPFAMVIGGYLARRLGPRTAACIGCYTMCASVFLAGWAIQHSYYAFLLTYGLMFGLGQGIAYVIAVSCVINWAPQMVGLGSGIVAAGFGISSSIFAPIQTSLINPHNVAPTRDGYFNDKELLGRVPGIFTTLSVVYFLMQCIGLVFICDPPAEFARRFLVHDCTSLIDMAWLSKRRSNWLASNGGGPPLLSAGWAQAKRGLTRVEQFGRYQYSKLSAVADDDANPLANENQQRFQDDESQLTNSFPTPPNESVSSDNDEEEEDQLEIARQGLPPVSFDPRQMMRSSTFVFLFISLFCCSFYGNFFYNLYKTFGETFIDDDFFLAMAFSLGSVANAAARIGWGLLTDRTSFQTSLCMATSLATVLLLTMPMTALAGRYVYLIWLILMFVCLAATHALFITAIVRCFGSQHKIINYGFLILSTTLSGIVLAIGSEYFLHAIGYNWAFILTAGFPFIAFLLTSAIRITPQGHLIVSK